MKNKNNYDRLAPFYDMISHIVYRDALIMAQRSVLRFIKDEDKILIVGGGTGKILEEIERTNKKNITVTYLEASAKMIELAQKRKYSFPVQYVCAYAENAVLETQFDVIITPFFFDNFPKEKCLQLLEKLDKNLILGGSFFYIDFRLTEQNSKIWKKMLLNTMYFFFKVITRIETNQLVDMHSLLNEKYQWQWSQYSFHQFVYAAVYLKK